MAIVGWRKDKKYCRNRSLRLCRRIFMYTKHIFSLSWYLTQLRFVQVLLLISSKLEQIILRLFDFSRRILILPFTQFKTRNRWKLFLFMFHFLSLSLSLFTKKKEETLGVGYLKSSDSWDCFDIYAFWHIEKYLYGHITVLLK